MRRKVLLQEPNLGPAKDAQTLDKLRNFVASHVGAADGCSGSSGQFTTPIQPAKSPRRTKVCSPSQEAAPCAREDPAAADLYITRLRWGLRRADRAGHWPW